MAQIIVLAKLGREPKAVDAKEPAVETKLDTALEVKPARKLSEPLGVA